MKDPARAPIDQLVEAVQQSIRYRHIGEEFIRDIGERELAIRRNLKEAIKATKSKLHQVAGAYIEEDMPYRIWLDELASAAGNPQHFRQVCLRIMAHHASTRERLGILEEFYATTLDGLPPIRSVLDLACGLNPLAIPWMPLESGVAYYACDIYKNLIAFLAGTFDIMAAVNGYAKVCDLVKTPCDRPADLALLLKTLPILEQVDKTAGVRLLRALNVRYLLVSFPAASLGGREKGMVHNYEAHFHQATAGAPWQVQRFEFPTELAFLVDKRPGT